MKGRERVGARDEVALSVQLDLSYTRVSDVSALAGCPALHTLSLLRTQVTDVSALAQCTALRKLYLYGTPVSDVSALAGYPIDVYGA